jgi:hypothetical protein
MSLPEKIAWVNGILLGVSETLPLVSTNVTEATSLLTLLFKSLRRKHAKHRRQTGPHRS